MGIHGNRMWLALSGLLAMTMALLLAAPLRAQPSPDAAAEGKAAEAPAEMDEATKLKEAKRLYREGNAMRKVEDYERALALYLESRELVASGPNTMNAAFCLDKLERYDEALEMYEVLLTQFPDELTDEDHEVVKPMVARLRGLVGSVQVVANVEGDLVIDGRPRGELPTPTPVRVLPGKRQVSVQKEGYESFETMVEVEAGEVVEVNAKLDPLAASGRVRLEETSVRCHGAAPEACVGAEVFVDGAHVGTMPWEGSLAPGSHWLVLRKGNMGSAPTSFVVVKGQLVSPTVVAAPLGPEIEIEVVPRTAALHIGDVAVGTAGWKGRLPLGVHELRAHEEGYFDGGHKVRIDPGTSGKVVLNLEVDEAHERWGVREAEMGAAGVLTFVGYGVGLAGVAVGSIFGVMTMNEKKDLEAECVDTFCTQDDIDKLSNKAHVSTIGFVAAGAGITLGTIAMVVWLSEDEQEPATASLALRPYGLTGLTLEGRF